MNEEFEREQRGLSLDIGVADEFQATLVEMRADQRVKNEAELLGTTVSPKYELDVQSVFDVRPVNAVDTLFSGIVELRAP